MLKTLINLTRPARYWWDSRTFRSSTRVNKLHEIKNIYKGKPMLVVGNGPSINNTPLHQFSNIPSIGMNKIDMLFDKTTWRPSLIVCVNNLVVKQNWKKWLQEDIPVHLSWKSRHYISRKKREDFEYFLSVDSRQFSVDVSKYVGSCGTVTFTALQYAHYMGADPVIIVGVDHSFQVSEGSKPADIEKRKGVDVNHFDPNYFAAGSYWGVPDLESSEIAYAHAREMFERDGRRIYDATIGGKLNIFDKIDIDQAIRMISETRVEERHSKLFVEGER